MTTTATCRDARHVTRPRPDRPYLDAWLRRAGKHLAASGNLSQTATVLARENGGTTDEWRALLIAVLDRRNTPSLELLTRIDALLAGPPAATIPDNSAQSLLFP